MSFTKEQALDAAKWWANYLPFEDSESLSAEKRGRFIYLLANKIMEMPKHNLHASEHEYMYMRSYYHTPREIMEIAVSAGIVSPELWKCFPKTASMVLLDDGQIHIYDIGKQDVLRESDNESKHISPDSFDFSSHPYLTAKMGKVLVEKIEKNQVGFVKSRYRIDKNEEEGWLYVQQRNQPESINVEKITRDQAYPATMAIAEQSYVSAYITDTPPDEFSNSFDGIPSRFYLRQLNNNGLYEYRSNEPIKIVKMEHPFTIGFGKEAQIGSEGDFLLYNTKNKTMSIASQQDLLDLGAEFYLSDNSGCLLQSEYINLIEPIIKLNLAGLQQHYKDNYTKRSFGKG